MTPARISTNATRTSADAQQHVAAEIADRVAAGPCVLGLATGGTMRGLYERLVALDRERGLDWSRVAVFLLDEYVGLEADDPRSMRAFVQGELIERLARPPERVHAPTEDLLDAFGAAPAYERALEEAGGIDLQLLGIGRNGHVAFNEPGSSADSTTRLVELAPETRADAARAFGGLEQVPAQAVTMGVATIRRARSLRMLAFGRSKGAALRRALLAPPSAETPASLLQGHPDLEVWLDQEAGLELSAD